MDNLNFWVPLVIALIGITGPIVNTYLTRRKSNAEAMMIYDTIEASNAKRAAEQIQALEVEVKRLRKLLKSHGLNPDEGITGPLPSTPKGEPK